MSLLLSLVVRLTAPACAPHAAAPPPTAPPSTRSTMSPARLADPPGPRWRGAHGQATTEYALVLLAAAMVALLVIAWAAAGDGGAQISRLFNRVIDAVVDRV